MSRITADDVLSRVFLGSDLLEACYHGDIGAMRALRAKGAVPWYCPGMRFAAEGIEMKEPIEAACVGGQPLALTWLLDWATSPACAKRCRWSENYVSPLRWAHRSRNVDCAKILLERGFNLVRVHEDVVIWLFGEGLVESMGCFSYELWRSEPLSWSRQGLKLVRARAAARRFEWPGAPD